MQLRLKQSEQNFSDATIKTKIRIRQMRSETWSDIAIR